MCFSLWLCVGGVRLAAPEGAHGLGKGIAVSSCPSCCPCWFAWTLVIFCKAVLQAHLFATLLAGVGVDGTKLFSAAVSWTSRSLVYFGIVRGVTACPGVLLEHCVGVISGSQLDCLRAYRAYNRAGFPRAGLSARMFLVRAVFQAKSQVTAVALEREKVVLLTIGYTALLTQAE